MNTHSPGPWRFFTHSENGEKRQESGPLVRFLYADDGQGFAHTVGLSDGVDEANARLMTAAPDLLDVCKRIQNLDRAADILAGNEGLRYALQAVITQAEFAA